MPSATLDFAPGQIDDSQEVVSSAPISAAADNQLSPTPTPQLIPPQRDYGIKPPNLVAGAALTPTPSVVGPKGKEALIAAARAAAQKYGVPEEVFVNQISGESSFNPNAANSVGPGHVGIAQFDPSTAAAYGVNRTDPLSSLDGAARYMADLRAKTGSWSGALQRYVGAATPQGLSRVLSTNPGYAAAWKAAGGGEWQPYAGGGFRTGLHTPAGALGSTPDFATALTNMAPVSNDLAPQQVAKTIMQSPQTPAGGVNNLALLALLAAGTHKITPVNYDPFKGVPEKTPLPAMPAIPSVPQIATEDTPTYTTHIGLPQAVRQYRQGMTS